MIDIAAVQSGVATRPSQSPNPLSPRPPPPPQLRPCVCCALTIDTIVTQKTELALDEAP